MAEANTHLAPAERPSWQRPLFQPGNLGAQKSGAQSPRKVAELVRVMEERVPRANRVGAQACDSDWVIAARP